MTQELCDMNAPCTCTGCPPAIYRILAHWWQKEAFILHKQYEPCLGPDKCLGPEGPEKCCGCPDMATQEDMLCDQCREKHGISYLDTERLEAWLSIHARVNGEYIE